MRRPGCLARGGLGLVAAFGLVACDASKPAPVVLPAATPASLAAHSAEFTPEVVKVTDGVYVAVGYGLANAILLEGTDGVVIVDTLETLEAAARVEREFRKITDKPVKAIIYTHSHPDHIGGAAAFVSPGTAPEIFAQEDVAQNMDKVASDIRPVLTRRSMRMYGEPLPPGERINLGIGGFLDFHAGSTVGTLRPTRTFRDRLEDTVAGIHLVLVHAPGETEDQIYVWLPDRQVLLCGDNFYKAFPNLYTIRGTGYRDPKRWAASLDQMRALHAAFLVPSHTRPLAGAEAIASALTDYRDAIRYTYDQTIRLMNQGLLPDEIAARLHLPPALAASPYLQEFYGKPSWSAKSIFSGTLGWYSGDPTDLQPLEPTALARRMVDLAGGAAELDRKIASARDAGDWQWVLQLTGYALRGNASDRAAIAARVAALRGLAEKEANPPARDWYFTAARELEGSAHLSIDEIKPTPAMLATIPMSVFFDGMAVNLHAEDCADRVVSTGFEFTDTGERFTYTVRRGVSEVVPGIADDADLTVRVSAQTFKEMLAGIRSPLATIATEFEVVHGNKVQLAQFLKWFAPENEAAASSTS